MPISAWFGRDMRSAECTALKSVKTLCHVRDIVGLAVVENEEEVEKFFFNQTASIHALGAVVFDEESFYGDQLRRNATITYKIRLRAEQYNGTYRSEESQDQEGTTSKWLTGYIFPTTPSVGPRGDMYGDPEPGKDEQCSYHVPPPFHGRFTNESG